MIKHHKCKYYYIRYFAAARCPDVDVDDSVQMTKDPKYKGALIEFSCEDGRTLEGVDVLYCDGDSWNADPPRCLCKCISLDFIQIRGKTNDTHYHRFSYVITYSHFDVVSRTMLLTYYFSGDNPNRRIGSMSYFSVID